MQLSPTTIQTLRENAGWSRAVLGEHASTDRTLIWRIEQDGHTNVREITAKRIADALGVTVDEIRAVG